MSLSTLPPQALLQRWWPRAPLELVNPDPAITAHHLVAYLRELGESRTEAVRQRIEFELLADAVEGQRLAGEPERAARLAMEGTHHPVYGPIRGYDDLLVRLLSPVQNTLDLEAFGTRLYHHLVTQMRSGEAARLEERVWTGAVVALGAQTRILSLEERLLEARARRFHERGDISTALTLALQGCPHPVQGTSPIVGYERTLHLYLAGRVVHANDLEEAYAICCARLTESLADFRWHSRLKRYCLRVAASAAASLHQDGYRKRVLRPLQTPDHPVAAGSRSRTRRFLRSSVKAVARRLFCENLSEEDWTIVFHRIYEGANWRDIAVMVLDDDASEHAVKRKSAQLRQHFKRRIKPRLKELVLALTSLREAHSAGRELI